MIRPNGVEPFPAKPGDKRPVFTFRVGGHPVPLRFRFPLATAFIRGSRPLDRCPREEIDLSTRVILKRPVQPDPYNLGDD